MPHSVLRSLRRECRRGRDHGETSSPRSSPLQCRARPRPTPLTTTPRPARPPSFVLRSVQCKKRRRGVPRSPRAPSVLSDPDDDDRSSIHPSFLPSDRGTHARARVARPDLRVRPFPGHSWLSFLSSGRARSGRSLGDGRADGRNNTGAHLHIRRLRGKRFFIPDWRRGLRKGVPERGRARKSQGANGENSRVGL